MKRDLKKLIADKREWGEALSPEDIARGFKGWYASKYLPHFDSPGAEQFITYRLADSVPVSRRREWKSILAIEEDAEKRRRIELFLDQGLGACHLRNPRIAQIVQENLWHHDGRKYRLLAWSIMPNHVHVLIEVWHVPLRRIVNSWKGYTSRKANEALGLSGTFWAEDYFDRYIRDETHFFRVRHYIDFNAYKAGLAKTPEAWPWSSARYRRHEMFSGSVLTHPGAERVPMPPVQGESP